MSLRIKKTLKIQGMTCTQCEKILHKTLMKIEGVSEAQASFKHSTVQVIYDSEKADENQLREAIRRAGYEALGDAQAKKHGGTLTPLQLAGIGVLLAALYLLINKTVGFSFIPKLDASMSYGMLFVVGLLTSLHCIAMCGGINLSQCLVPKSDGKTAPGWKPSLLYNGGRVISYTIVGGIVGALGSVISFSGGARGMVAILAGGFMVIMGINMLGLVPALRGFQIRMPQGIRNTLMGKTGERGPLVVGLLNGLMPCGPLQAMQLYALGTGSAAAGALSMFFFSLGTVPLMFGFGALSTLLSKRFTRNMLRFSAVLVILLGAVMMQRGFSLSGAVPLSLPNAEPAVSSTENAADAARTENGVQMIQGEVEPSAYPAIVVKKGVPVRFNLHVEEKNLNGCNSAIVIPEFNIQKKLAVGDNIIEFTPDKTGTFGYACWMGMISSEITVEE